MICLTLKLMCQAIFLKKSCSKISVLRKLSVPLHCEKETASEPADKIERLNDERKKKTLAREHAAISLFLV